MEANELCGIGLNLLVAYFPDLQAIVFCDRLNQTSGKPAYRSLLTIAFSYGKVSTTFCDRVGDDALKYGRSEDEGDREFEHAGVWEM